MGKKIFRLVILLLIAVCIAVFIVKSIRYMRNSPCSGIKVNIEYTGENAPVSQEEIIQLINNRPIPTIGIPLKEIQLDTIRHLLEQHPYISSVDKIRFVHKVLTINITIKKFFLHVYPIHGEDYFVSEEGEMLPFSDKVKERLIIVNGNVAVKFKPKGIVTNSKKGNTLRSAYLIAQEIEKDGFSKAQYRQIFVNDTREIELIPSVGRMSILFGNEENAEEKLKNLQATYRHGITYMDISNYKQLDVRFKNRVIAKKKQY